MKRAPRSWLFGAVLFAVVTAACSGSGGVAATSPQPGPGTFLSPLARPTDRPVNPDFDYGQEVEITAGGFVPRELIAAVDFPVTWKNSSGHTQAIHFDNNGGIDSGPIPSGGAWSYTPHVTVSIVYHSTVDSDLHGGVQVQPLTEP
jgi:hypothetical protein